jgi:hypothetical protein
MHSLITLIKRSSYTELWIYSKSLKEVNILLIYRPIALEAPVYI